MADSKNFGKSTAFDKSTGPAGEAELVEEVEGGVHVPRVVFTRDQKLDIKNLQIGQLRIAQGATQEVKDRKAQVGDFVLSNYQAVQAVIVIPLFAGNNRIYKPDPKSPPMCQAPTGEWGFGNPGGQCWDFEKDEPVCPLAKWGEYSEITKSSKPPLCKEGIVVRMYSVTHRAMVDYQFSGSERRQGGFIQQQGMGFGWGSFGLRMTAKNKENNRGSWAVPDLEMLSDNAVDKDGKLIIPQEQWDLAMKFLGLVQDNMVDTKEQALIQLKAVN